MFQIILSFLSMISSTIFMQMKHPLAMGLMLMIQTFFICIISGNYSKTFWFSYILFLIFLGGMLVLFIYVTSLASNEMFNFSMKILIMSMLTLAFFTIILFFMDKTLLMNYIFNSETEILNEQLYNISKENSISLNKLYNFPTNLITILLINYLFLTLIAAVKITKNLNGPLRPKMI
uniref:NADH-ubiquinone oxidoreductase chain 6 n=1 Tax=Propsilocerus sinicus TaxID=2789522 RepID=A0A8K1NJM8_9DIPT|nr:NADH dehydrogenase subunit 6 [Propsilocerus sinicus]UDD74664.1 NADH dehydrogenase subunit 6 [Propsilocerus sinicus]